MDKPKLCPFCGSDNVQALIGADDVNNAEFCVTCWDCRVMGPVSYASLDEAIERWNDRCDHAAE